MELSAQEQQAVNLGLLIAALKKVEDNVEIIDIVPESIQSESGSYSEDDLHQDIINVLSLANYCLINSDGSCNFAAHVQLKQHGFPVRKGESDSFGWLSGLIRTRKGDIMYG